MTSAGDIELVRRMLAAYSERGGEGAREFLHPQVEYDTSTRPDGRVWHGLEGVRRALADWTETWDDFEVDFEDYLDAGEGRVAAPFTERGRAKASGVPVSETGVMVFTVRDGLITAIMVSVERERVLRELGAAAKPRA
jgi:ketosteroid isomerase-like protein